VGSEAPFQVIIAPEAAKVEYSIIRKAAPMEHGYTVSTLSRTVADEEWIALVVQASGGQKVSVTVSQGPRQHATARGRSVSLSVVGGRASVSAFE
jgi:hypothetical protein